MLTPWVVVVLLLLVFDEQVVTVLASIGNNSPINNRCVTECNNVNCVALSDEDYALRQPVYMRILGWSCYEECSYSCMWRTVDAFKQVGSPVPQFHGKWPFVRLLGIQEPASVLFSILNAVPHIVMLMKYRQAVPPKAPLYYIVHANAAVGINAWFWSTVFHSRDFPFTEMMDYFGAISLIIFNTFVLCTRLLRGWRLVVSSAALAVFFVCHVYYLGFVKFDYSYNMKAMVTVGVLSSVGWLSWSLHVRRLQPYVWKMMVGICCLNLLILLEVFDFPPILWVLDAHSLWHAGTIPLSLLWYSFTIEDSLYQVWEMEDKIQQLGDKKAS